MIKYKITVPMYDRRGQHRHTLCGDRCIDEPSLLHLHPKDERHGLTRLERNQDYTSACITSPYRSPDMLHQYSKLRPKPIADGLPTFYQG